MGYIPPIRDAQVFEYGNRIRKDYQGIRPVSPIAHGNFYKVVTNQQTQGHYVERNMKKYRSKRHKTNQGLSKKDITAKINEITGKGNQFDMQI